MEDDVTAVDELMICRLHLSVATDTAATPKDTDTHREMSSEGEGRGEDRYSNPNECVVLFVVIPVMQFLGTTKDSGYKNEYKSKKSKRMSHFLYWKKNVRELNSGISSTFTFPPELIGQWLLKYINVVLGRQSC